MEFHIRLAGSTPDLGAIEQALLEADPSAVADIDSTAAMMRIATSLDAVRLLAAVRSAGLAVDVGAVSQLPSICCGGCSG